MPKFGLFDDANNKPSQEFEAEEMHYAGTDIVTFINRVPQKPDKHVGIVKLIGGECIKLIQP